MSDERDVDFPYLAARQVRSNGKPADTEVEEDSCAAFGFLRGPRERALGIEFRFRTGDSVMFSYSLLAGWKYDPSVGLLLRFMADIPTDVLIRGSNLRTPVPGGTVNLLEHGIQRHRVIWVRVMPPEESKAIGSSGPTIDQIDIITERAPERLNIAASIPANL